MGCLTRETRRAVPSIGRTALLLLIDGDLPQQWYSLTVPIQYEGVVGCHHGIVALANSLQAAAKMHCHDSLMACS